MATEMLCAVCIFVVLQVASMVVAALAESSTSSKTELSVPIVSGALAPLLAESKKKGTPRVKKLVVVHDPQAADSNPPMLAGRKRTRP